MRLAQMISDPSVFDYNTRLMLFHGTHSGHRSSFEQGLGIATEGPTDFGPGFYLTAYPWQAMTWARKRGKQDGEKPLLITVQTTLKKLRRRKPERTLVFDAYDEAWAATIRAGRVGQKLEYDWICGPCADNGATEIPAQDWPEDPSELVRLLTPSSKSSMFYFEQLWFGTVEAIGACLTNTVIIDLS